MAEFKTNNYKSDFAKISLFFAIKNLYLHINFNIIDFSNIIIYEKIIK